MAIEDILQALQEQSESDCQECLAEARDHAAHILREAEREAAVISDRHVQQITRAAESAAARKVNAARLEAKMRVSSVKGDGLEGVFEQAAARLAEIRSRGDYPVLFEQLGREALEGVSGEVVVHVGAPDSALGQRLLESTGASGRVEADIDTAGGALVEVDGGRVLRRNTLEDRLDRARELVQADAAKVLLG